MKNLYLLLALIAGLMISHWLMYSTGKDVGERVAIEREVEAYVAQRKVEGTVAGLSAEQLCIGIGGLPDDCRKLRVD